MGVRFAMERRDWKQLLKDRAFRILIPYVFGYFFICPVFVAFLVLHFGGAITYQPNAGHLWFLLNIFLYVLLLLPLLVHLRKNPENPVYRFLLKIFRWPGALFVFAIPLVAEAWIINPADYPLYAQTWHGFWLGMVCFLTGFIMVSLGEIFWNAVERIRFVALGIGLGLYLVRWFHYQLAGVPNPLIALESLNWVLAVLGLGSCYLNRPSKLLAKLSNAVYPVYIVHMPVQYGISYFLIPLPMPALLKLLLLTIGTFGISFLLYEYVLHRLKWIRPLFGMKFRVR